MSAWLLGVEEGKPRCAGFCLLRRAWGGAKLVRTSGIQAEQSMDGNEDRWRPVLRTQRAERCAGKGTPTSGQFSRWGPAPLRKAQRNHVSPRSRMTPLSARTPTGRAARRQGNADLRPVLPVGASTLRTAQRNHVSPHSRMTPLSARTPTGRAARRQGNADLRSAPPRAAGRAAQS